MWTFKDRRRPGASLFRPDYRSEGSMDKTKTARHPIGIRRLFAISAVLCTAVSQTPASAQQLTPFRIGSQTPPIFEYVYINYAIEGGFLRKAGDRRQVRRLHRRAHDARKPWPAAASMRHAMVSPGPPAPSSAARRRKTVYSVNSDNTYVIVSRDRSRSSRICAARNGRSPRWAPFRRPMRRCG